jgi:NADH-quinone oxidoreductase subunit K
VIPYLALSAAMFVIGAFGALSRRNLLIILMCVELMLNGVNIALVAFARFHANVQGHVFVLMVMGVAAAEVAVGLALIIALFRLRKTVNTGDLTKLKG